MNPTHLPSAGQSAFDPTDVWTRRPLGIPKKPRFFGFAVMKLAIVLFDVPVKSKLLFKVKHIFIVIKGWRP